MVRREGLEGLACLKKQLFKRVVNYTLVYSNFHIKIIINDSFSYFFCRLKNFVSDSDEMKSCLNNLENKARNMEDSIGA